jgi:hypothetical protein
LLNLKKTIGIFFALRPRKLSLGNMVKYSLLLFLLISSANSVAATDISCANKSFKWSKTKPAINLRHIFCGEINYRGRAKGFHSTQLLATATDVKNVYRKKKLRGGIYNARVEFVNGKTKFSTFFPKQCTVAMIVRSVAYAARNKTKDHPQWGILGPSAPKKKSQGYCLNNRGKPFTIRMGLTRNHRRINTAFPQP